MTAPTMWICCPFPDDNTSYMFLPAAGGPVVLSIPERHLPPWSKKCVLRFPKKYMLCRWEAVLKILKMASKHPEPIPKAKVLVLWNKIRRHNKPTWVVNSIQFFLIFIGAWGNIQNKWMFPLISSYIEGNNSRGIKAWKGQKGTPIIPHAACKMKWSLPALGSSKLCYLTLTLVQLHFYYWLNCVFIPIRCKVFWPCFILFIMLGKNQLRFSQSRAWIKNMNVEICLRGSHGSMGNGRNTGKGGR